MFIFQTSHSAAFGRAVGTFLATHHISVTALADAMLFLGLAMILANRCLSGWHFEFNAGR